MSNRCSTRGWARAAFVVASALACAAAAYVLPGGSILRRMVEAREDLRLFTLRVEGTLSFFGDAAKEAGAAMAVPADRPELQVDATILLKLPGRCRLEVAPVEGKPAASIASGGRPRREGNALPAADVLVSQVCAILALRTASDAEARAVLEKHLRELRVDLDAPTSLARWGGEVAYVLGKGGPGEPQFWVYKDSFLPARLKFKDKGGVEWDVHFYDYSSPATGEWFPRMLELDKNGALALRFTGLKGDVKAKLEDSLF